MPVSCDPPRRSAELVSRVTAHRALATIRLSGDSAGSAVMLAGEAGTRYSLAWLTVTLAGSIAASIRGAGGP